MLYVTNVVANVLFTVARILYSLALGGLAFIIFSKLRNGTSARYWYDQGIPAKITSFFIPGTLAGRGIFTIPVILAIVFTIMTAMLNYLPALLFYLSPSTRLMTSQTNETQFFQITPDFITPILSPAELPGFYQPTGALQSLNNYLCTKIGGCVDLAKGLNQTITWQQVNLVPTSVRSGENTTAEGPYMGFYKSSDNDEIGTLHIHGLKLATINNSTSTVVQQGSGSLFVFQQGPPSTNLTSNQEFRNAYSDYLQMKDLSTLPWNGTLDMSYFGRNGMMPFEDIYSWGNQFFAVQQWTVAHTTPINSTLIWQSTVFASFSVPVATAVPRILNMFNITASSNLAVSIQNVYNSSMSENSNSTFLISKTITQANLRTLGVSCKISPYTIFGSPNAAPRLYLYCSQTSTQMWTVDHPQYPIDIVDDSVVIPGGYVRPNRLECTDIVRIQTTNDNAKNPIFYRAYRLYQSLASVPCTAAYNATGPILLQMVECARNTLYLPNISETNEISEAAWQLAAVMNAVGMTIPYQYGVLDTFVELSDAVVGILIASAVATIGAFIALFYSTTSIQRHSLYQVLRSTAPTWQSEKEIDRAQPNMLQLEFCKERDQISLTLDNEPVMVYYRTRGEDSTLLDEKESEHTNIE